MNIYFIFSLEKHVYYWEMCIDEGPEYHLTLTELHFDQWRLIVSLDP